MPKPKIPASATVSAAAFAVALTDGLDSIVLGFLTNDRDDGLLATARTKAVARAETKKKTSGYKPKLPPLLAH